MYRKEFTAFITAFYSTHSLTPPTPTNPTNKMLYFHMYRVCCIVVKGRTHLEVAFVCLLQHILLLFCFCVRLLRERGKIHQKRLRFCCDTDHIQILLP